MTVFEFFRSSLHPFTLSFHQQIREGFARGFCLGFADSKLTALFFEGRAILFAAAFGNAQFEFAEGRWIFLHDLIESHFKWTIHSELTVHEQALFLGGFDHAGELLVREGARRFNAQDKEFPQFFFGLS